MHATLFRLAPFSLKTFGEIVVQFFPINNWFWYTHVGFTQTFINYACFFLSFSLSPPPPQNILLSSLALSNSPSSQFHHRFVHGRKYIELNHASVINAQYIFIAIGGKLYARIEWCSKCCIIFSISITSWRVSDWSCLAGGYNGRFKSYRWNKSFTWIIIG